MFGTRKIQEVKRLPERLTTLIVISMVMSLFAILLALGGNRNAN